MSIIIISILVHIILYPTDFGANEDFTHLTLIMSCDHFCYTFIEPDIATNRRLTVPDWVRLNQFPGKSGKRVSPCDRIV